MRPLVEAVLHCQHGWTGAFCCSALIARRDEVVRLDISSSDFPQWDRNPNTGAPTGTHGPAEAFVATQIVLHDAEHPSRLVLPVVDAF